MNKCESFAVYPEAMRLGAILSWLTTVATIVSPLLALCLMENPTLPVILVLMIPLVMRIACGLAMRRHLNSYIKDGQ